MFSRIPLRVGRFSSSVGGNRNIVILCQGSWITTTPVVISYQLSHRLRPLTMDNFYSTIIIKFQRYCNFQCYLLMTSQILRLVSQMIPCCDRSTQSPAGIGSQTLLLKCNQHQISLQYLRTFTKKRYRETEFFENRSALKNAKRYHEPVAGVGLKFLINLMSWWRYFIQKIITAIHNDHHLKTIKSWKAVVTSCLQCANTSET